MLSLLDVLPAPPPGKIGWPWTVESTPVPQAALGGELWPKISIVTPSYNQGQFLEETIRSVLLQNYPNLEYIIMDGGSTDDSVEIIQKYEPWLTYWTSERDEGQSDAINKGFNKTSGEIFNWLNSDDFYCENTLFAVSLEFAKDQGLTCVSGKEWHFYHNSANSGSIIEGTIVCNTLESTLFKSWIGQPATFFRRSPLNDLFPLSKDLHYLMDADLWCRYLLSNGLLGFKKIDNILVNFRYHDLSKSIDKSLNFGIEGELLHLRLLNFAGAPAELLREAERYASPSKEIGVLAVEHVLIDKKNLISLFYRKFAHYSYANHDYSKAKHFAKKYFKYGLADFNLWTLSLIIKIFAIPKTLLNFMRKIKSRFF